LVLIFMVHFGKTYINRKLPNKAEAV